MVKTYEISDYISNVKKTQPDDDFGHHLELVKHLEHCPICKNYLTSSLCPIGQRLLNLTNELNKE